MTQAGDLPVDVAGERLLLVPERVAYWPARSTLLVADPHVGKAAAFRALGVPVPAGTTLEGLARLDAVLRRAAVDRVVILGDFLHAKEGRAPGTLAAFAEWRRARESVDFVLVRGNHDRRAGDPPPELGVRCTDGPLVDGPFAFVHHPVAIADAYVIGGHLHPGVRLHGAGATTRLPAFWFGEHVGVLPAFGDFTGLAPIEAEASDRVYAIAGDSVIQVPDRPRRDWDLQRARR